MIVDACLFAGENDMLELRYRTLRDVVDMFVTVGCVVSHQGVPLPGPRVWPYPDGVWRDDPRFHATAVTPLTLFNNGQRSAAGNAHYQLIERQQRAGVRQAVWEQCHPDLTTIVMVSDVDEIPDPNVVRQFDTYLSRTDDHPFVLEQRFHSESLAYMHPQKVWYGTTVSRWKDCDPHAHRQARGEWVEDQWFVSEAGWHLSWFGTDADRDWKVHAFSHGEVADAYDPAEGRRQHVHANGEVLFPVNPDGLRWPEPIHDGTFDVPAAWMSR